MADKIVRPEGPDGGLFGIKSLFRFQQDTLGFLSNTAENYGKLVYFRMAAFHFYLVNSPDLISEALIGQGNKLLKWPRQTDTWANAVGPSTLTMEGDTWKSHRKLLNPAFHSQTIKRYLGIVIDHTERLLNRWQDGGTYEMMFEMMRTTMGIIADIIFSVKDIERDAAELNRALTDVFEVLTARTTAFQQIPSWIPTRDNLRIKEASRIIENFVLKFIRERRAEGLDHGDILSDLLMAQDDETGAKLSDIEIANELKTLFGAGHETTALMLMWTIYLLAMNTDVQENLFIEAKFTFNNRSPLLEDLKVMPYTEKVINESMRLYPPAWSLMVRQAKEPLQLGDTLLPKGSLLLIPMWIVHRNPNIYPDPLRFDPERFDGEWRKRIPKYAFFPFGGGPHVCIGAQLAMFEGQIILPMMVKSFRFEDVARPEIKLQALLTLRPKGGLKIKVIKR